MLVDSSKHWLIRLCAACGLLFGLLLIASPNYRWNRDKGDSPYGSDFLQEWTAANMLVNDQAALLYDAPAFDAWQHDSRRIGFTWDKNAYYPSVYPPPYYWLLGPLGWLEYRWAVPIWLALLLLSVIAAASVIEATLQRFSASPQKPTSTRGQTWFWMAMLLSPPLLLSLTMGQKGAVWLFILAATWSLLRQGKPGWAGCVFGLLSVKPTLFFLLPLWMLYHRQWRFIASASLVWGSLWLAAACHLPSNVWSEYLEVVRGAGSYHQHAGYQLNWSCNLMSLQHGLHSPWWPAWIGWTLIGILSAFVVMHSGSNRSTETASKRAGLDGPQLASVLVATCLLSPHFYAYDLVVLLLPVRVLWNQQPKLAAILLGSVCAGMWGSQLCYHTIGLPLMPIVLLGALYSLSAVTPGQSSVRKGVNGNPAPSNILQTGLSPQA